MQTTPTISLDRLKEIAHAIFDQGPVVVKEAYSDYDCPTREFQTADALMKSMTNSPIEEDKAFFSYVLYYPEANVVFRK